MVINKLKECIMWVRIKGVLYNLALVKSIDFNHRLKSIEIVFTSVITRPETSTQNGYYNDSAYIEFNEIEDAKAAYSHIIKTIDIPQLKQDDFHD
jgi:hypothetical protein